MYVQNEGNYEESARYYAVWKHLGTWFFVYVLSLLRFSGRQAHIWYDLWWNNLWYCIDVMFFNDWYSRKWFFSRINLHWLYLAFFLFGRWLAGEVETWTGLVLRNAELMQQVRPQTVELLCQMETKLQEVMFISLNVICRFVDASLFRMFIGQLEFWV